MSDGACVFASERAHVEICLKFAEMLPARFSTPRIFLKSLGVAANLRRYEGEHVGGNSRPRRARGRKLQKGKMRGKPQSVRRAPPLTNQRQVLGREGVVPNDRRRLCRRIEQRGAGLRREDFVFLHAVFFVAQTANAPAISTWNSCDDPEKPASTP